MAPGPTLEQLIATVRRDAGSDDPLDQLATAARMAADLQDVADAALSHFVDQCRHSGRSWTEISTALGVTKQAAHKRFSETQLLGRFTPRVRNLFVQAAAAARRLGHNYVGTEHVLLALFGESEALSARVLAQTGATYDDYRRRVIDKLSRLVVARPEQ